MPPPHTHTLTGVETLGGKYELHDLVQLDAHTAGVIVGIDKDTARVLTNQSTLQKTDIRLCKVGGVVVLGVWARGRGCQCAGCIQPRPACVGGGGGV